MNIDNILRKLNESKTERRCYEQRIATLKANGRETAIIERGVSQSLEALESGTRSFVIYGEPQSGKTEFMIALVCKLLDEGRKTIFIIMNDNTELESQNFDRFRKAKEMNPTPLRDSQVVNSSPSDQKKDRQRVIFCRKNAKNLEKLVHACRFMEDRLVIDDEADYATPNSKINKEQFTAINSLVGKLGKIGASQHGTYIGVTATPARLDLNNTFLNDSKKWVFLDSHENYKGRKFFFPTTDTEISDSDYNLVKLPDDTDNPILIRHAVFRFLIRVILLNILHQEKNTAYSMLIHTAGKTNDHSVDEQAVKKILNTLRHSDDKNNHSYIRELQAIAIKLVAEHQVKYSADDICVEVLKNIGRSEVLIINHKNESQNVQRASDPQALFTFAIGGNIVSRGLTFENLLTFYFSRTVTGKLQQNTYIQRARMFGSRKYSSFFELCVPQTLFKDWADVFHHHELSLRLAKAGVYQHIQSKSNTVVDSGSLDKKHVTVEKSERAVGSIFQLTPELEQEFILGGQGRPISFLEGLLERELISEAHLPSALLAYIRETAKADESDILIVLRKENGSNLLQNIERYESDGDPQTITRHRGGIVHAMLNKRIEYDENRHFILPIKNLNGQARFLYSSRIGHSIMQNLRVSKPTL